MTLAPLVLVAFFSPPKVVVLQGTAEGVDPRTIAVVLDDVEGHLKAAGLDAARSELRCGTEASCFVDAARSQGGEAMLIVSFSSGPSGLTVDLDARRPLGEALDVLTTGVDAKGRLPATSDPFFAKLAQVLTRPDHPQVKPTPEVEPSVAAAPFTPVKPLLISGGALLVISAGLFVVALVLSNQLGGRLSTSGVITGLTRAQAQSQASLANALATGSLISGLLGCALAGVGGVWALFGPAPSSELVEER